MGFNLITLRKNSEIMGIENSTIKVIRRLTMEEGVATDFSCNRSQ